MKNLVCKSFLALGMFALSLSALAEGNIDNGETIAKAECAACHGADGNSAAPMFPKIAGLGERYLLKQLRDIKNATDSGDAKKAKRVVPEMVGLLDDKSEQELQDLAAYYAAQPMQLTGAKELKVQVNSGAQVDALKLGARIYRAGNLETGVPACSGCHSPRGLGNAPAGYPRLSGQFAEYVEKQLRDFRAGNRTNDGDSMVMREAAQYMSDAEIKAVANFIAGLN